MIRIHVWRRCQPKKRYLCTSYSEKNGRCFGDAVVHCVKRGHQGVEGCEARCNRHKPRTAELAVKKRKGK